MLLAIGLNGHPEAIVGNDLGVAAFVMVEAGAEVVEVFEHFLDGLLGHARDQQHLAAIFIPDIDVLFLLLA